MFSVPWIAALLPDDPEFAWPMEEVWVTPGWTACDRREEYQTCDIAALLAPGRTSEIRLFAASSWWGLGLASYTEAELETRLKACLQIEMTDASGVTTVLTTDASWHAEPCAGLQSSIHHGEVQDFATSAGGVAWNRLGGDRIHFTLDVPAGLSATVELPGLPAAELAGPASGSWAVTNRRGEEQGSCNRWRSGG